MVRMDIDTNQFWQDLSSNIRRFIYRQVKNENDTEDILQDVILKIYTNINCIQDNKKIYAWIYKIARNTIIDFYRKKKNTIELPDIPEENDIDNDERQMNSEVVLCLKTMIGYLPDKYRQAIMLTELGNLTQKEMAKELGMSISGAKSRVQRARAMLKEMLLQCCKFQIDAYGNIVEYEHKQNSCKYC